jgi:hypothetical protein
LRKIADLLPLQDQRDVRVRDQVAVLGNHIRIAAAPYSDFRDDVPHVSEADFRHENAFDLTDKPFDGYGYLHVWF